MNARRGIRIENFWLVGAYLFVLNKKIQKDILIYWEQTNNYGNFNYEIVEKMTLPYTYLHFTLLMI